MYMCKVNVLFIPEPKQQATVKAQHKSVYVALKLNRSSNRRVATYHQLQNSLLFP